MNKVKRGERETLPDDIFRLKRIVEHAVLLESAKGAHEDLVGFDTCILCSKEQAAENTGALRSCPFCLVTFLDACAERILTRAGDIEPVNLNLPSEVFDGKLCVVCIALRVCAPNC